MTTVTDDHVEDFLRGVGEWQDDWSADARSEAIERHRQRSIHVHCWSQDEFSETLLHVVETGRQPGISSMPSSSRTWSTASSSGTCSASCPPTAMRRSSAPDFARCSSASVRVHRPNRERRKAPERLGRRRPRVLRSFSEAVPLDRRSAACAVADAPWWRGCDSGSSFTARTTCARARADARACPESRTDAPHRRFDREQAARAPTQRMLGLRGRHARVIHTATPLRSEAPLLCCCPGTSQGRYTWTPRQDVARPCTRSMCL